ncbi:dTDP-4-dehydrorhamnose reductase [Mobilisporobacter senegalensis]|uniref:dTDP-4-dehydrorhamnose reductase n=1 Tax=Mobilisporobacter senegalensis TaxID=1329262 RepID=A0A3N1XQ90_9FIRM|nr:dTDP-4-dehydrorhamnose reductase [Mobilisporobacter senegalensis]ROR28428.1 dTDP-4-dehydrorhamnose reductase [Mobilisporobacter senegalensis]
MKKILITGANGQLGRELNRLFADHKQDIELLNTEVVSIEEKNIVAMDITDFHQTRDVIINFMPDIIINCAAHTAVDVCESDKENAYRINAVGPKNLSLAAKEISAVLVQVSTDYVFDGNSTKPYTEESGTNPQSVYGETKLEGEKFVGEICEKYFIIRTAWLYGEGKNFVKTMLRLSESQEEVRVVSDQFGTPTSAKELSKMIIYLMNTNAYGIYHGTCEGSTSWADFAKEIYEQAKKTTRVIPITTKEYPTPAKRPAYSVLENKRLKELGGFTMKDWKDALTEYMEEVFDL